MESNTGAEVRARITASGCTIYSPPDDTFLETDQLESVLADSLRGLSLDYPLRTRAKVSKQAVCEALGYPVPRSFKKTRPRFPAQNLDVYVQKNDNLQIWNEEIDGERRYALIRVNDEDVVTTVRVLTGDDVAELGSNGDAHLQVPGEAARGCLGAGAAILTRVANRYREPGEGSSSAIGHHRCGTCEALPDTATAAGAHPLRWCAVPPALRTL